MKLQSLKLTPAEAAVLQGGQAASGSEAGAACLDSYGGGLEPGETLGLMLYHIRAAIDLGLAEHARKLFAGVMELLERHPELIQAARSARLIADTWRSERRRRASAPATRTTPGPFAWQEPGTVDASINVT